jgi:signal transduction histidine kinase
MKKKIKPVRKKVPLQTVSNLELTVANIALEKTNLFLKDLQKRLSKEGAENKASLKAEIKKEIQKNLKLQKLISTGKKKAVIDNADILKLREAIGVLETSKIVLSKTIKTEGEKYKRLEHDMETETSARRASLARLRQKDIEIEQLNREILTVAKISSHDLQEPLKNIQLFTSLLLEKEHDKLSLQGKEYFARMQTSVARVRKLMQDLSEYSHLNKSLYKVEKADLNKLLDQALQETNEVIVKTHAVVTSDDLPLLKVVPFHFKKIFKELICNSVTFTRPGVRPRLQVKCNITTGSELKGLFLSPRKQYYVISFIDNGAGFNPLYKDRIFEVFEKLDGKHAHGSGIGLATCKKIIENYDGRITADSVLGKGSTFKIFIAA